MNEQLVMIVNDLSPIQVKALIDRYEYQIRDSLRTMRKAGTFVEARVALNAANAARRKKEWLLEHAA